MKLGTEEYGKGRSVFKMEALKTIPCSKGLALDCGCGPGNYSLFLKNKNYDVIGVDSNKEALYVCKNKIQKTICLDLNAGTCFNDNTFDLVWCPEVIEHVKDPRALVNEIHRILKRNGALLLTTPNSYNFYWRFWYLFGKKPKTLQNPTHIHFFSKKTLFNLFDKNKWMVEDFFGIFPPIGYSKLPNFKTKRTSSFLCGNFVVKLRKR